MEQEKGFFYGVIRKRKLVILFVVFILIAGMASYASLPKQQYPIILSPAVTVVAVYPGASPEEIETLVTKKIEDLVMEAEGFDFCTSQSMNSASVVVVRFKLNMNESAIKQSQTDLRYKVEDLWRNDLPDGVTSVEFGEASLNTAGLILAFTGDEHSTADLVNRADELGDLLRKEAGVKKVEVSGKADERIQVTVDMDKLNRMSLSLTELSSLIGAKNSIIPVGNIEFENNKVTVETSGMFEDINEIAELIVDISSSSGAITELKDIAAIDRMEDEDAKRYQYNGQDAILLSLYYQDGINMAEYGKAVRETVEACKSQLPAGIEVQTIVDLAEDAEHSVNDFIINVLEAVLIVLVIIMLGMSFRNGGIVAVAIPVSIVVPFIAMKFLNIEVQFISLASLIMALGMLVDNAVVVSDAIQVRIDEGEDKVSACVGGVKSVAFPVLASTMTTVAIFVIFYALPGTMASFVFSLPTIVITALLASYVVSILVTPVMCYYLMKKSKPRKESLSLLGMVGNAVDKLLQLAFRHKALTVVICVALLIFSLGLLTTLSQEFMPKGDKPLVDISITTTNLNDIRKTEEAVARVVTAIQDLPETTFYLSAVGGSLPQYDFAVTPAGDGINKGNVLLGIDLKASGRFDNKSEFVEYLQKEMDRNIPGSHVVVKELQIVPEDGEPIQIKVLGDDFAKLNEAALVIEEELSKIEGAVNIYSDRQYQSHHYYVDMKSNILNTYGLAKASIQAELNTALMGREATFFRYGTKEYPVVVKSNIRSSEDLENMMVKSSSTGSKYQLKQIADVGIKPYYGTIVRYKGDRSLTITALPQTGYTAASVQNQLKSVLDEMDFGDIKLEYLGESKNSAEAAESMQVGVAIGVIGILLVLYIQFNSVRKMLIVFSAIPFCFVGASLGLVIFKPGFNLFTIMGMLSLMGVVVNNSIVLVDFINKERESGIALDEACKSAVAKRFRPVFLSTMTAVLGMLPLAIGGNALFKGLAVAFMCGDALSMFFTLIIVPVVYGAWEGSVEKKE